MFLQDSDIKAALAGRLKQKLADLEPYWDEIVTSAHQWAYNEIVTRFVSRGFLGSQVTGWDRGPEFEKSLAIWWCYDQGVMGVATDDKLLSKLDRRAELDTVQPIVGGVLQTPLGTTGRLPSDTNLGKTGEVGYGVQDTTRDEFTQRGFTPPLQPGRNLQSW